MQSQISLQPPKRDGGQTVVLRLGFETRFIGKLHHETFSCTRRQQHLHRRSNSLGLNYSLRTNPGISFKWVVVDFSGKMLVTSRRFWLARGHVYRFSGFELQSFLPLCEFGIEKARAFEAVAQPELFHD